MNGPRICLTLMMKMKCSCKFYIFTIKIIYLKFLKFMYSFREQSSNKRIRLDPTCQKYTKEVFIYVSNNLVLYIFYNLLVNKINILTCLGIHRRCCI